MSSDSYMLDKEIEDLKAELNQLTEMKYVFAECVYRFNLIITKEKSIIQSLENSEDFDVSSIRDYRSTIKEIIAGSNEPLDRLDELLTLFDKYRG